MKRFHPIRYLALVLALLTLLSAAVYAEPDPGPTDEELIQAYQIPDNWARKALLFAVRSGLLVGESGKGLRPTDNTTRAELATMLTRIAAVQQRADLSAFTDVSAKSWYYTPLAKAVALGLMKGTSKTRLSPKNNVTREEAFVMMARMFGVRGADRSALYDYADWKEVSTWAASDLAAMIRAGYVKGSGKKLDTKGAITRQEIAQVICNILDGFGTQLPERYRGSYALTAEEIAPGTVVKGDLLLCSNSQKITLRDVTVTGRLVFQGCESASLALKGCSIQTLVLCRNTSLSLDGGVQKLVSNARSVKLSGQVPALEVWESTVTVKESGAVGTADLMTARSKLCVNGTAQTVNVLEKNQTISGTGRIEQLNVYQSGLDLSCAVGKRNDDIDLGLTKVQVTKLENTKLAPYSFTAPASVRLENLEDVLREYEVCWYIGEKLVYRDEHFLLKGSGVCAAELDFSAFTMPGMVKATLPLTFTISWNGESCSRSYEADISNGIFPGLGKINAVKQETTRPTTAAPKAAASVKLTGMPLQLRQYEVAWYVDGNRQFTEKRTLKEGDVVRADLDFSAFMSPQTARNQVGLKFTISCNGETREFLFQADTSDAVVRGAAQVRTQNVQATVVKPCGFYSNQNLSGGAMTTLSYGTQVTYLTYFGDSSAQVRLANGSVGWVPYYSIRVSGANFYVTWDYSDAVKEYWINNIKRGTSAYPYLIWVNTYTQRVNIFKGGNGNWKLLHAFPCATGTNDHVTRVQDTKLLYKSNQWNFDGFYVDHICGFDNNGRAFHSRPKYYNTGAVYYYEMSRPASHGCVRMLDDGIQFIWNNCAIGTRVIVY